LEEYFDTIKPDVVINLASIIPYGSKNSLDPEILRVNALGVLNIATIAKKVGIKHFIQASSMAVYGNCMQGSPCVEYDDPPLPDNLYGVSKTAAEDILSLFIKDFGITILRISDVYGTGCKRKKLIETIIEKISNDETLVIDREYCLNDYVHVNDVVNAIILSLENYKWKNKWRKYNYTANLKNLSLTLIDYFNTFILWLKKPITETGFLTLCIIAKRTPMGPRHEARKEAR